MLHMRLSYNDKAHFLAMRSAACRDFRAKEWSSEMSNVQNHCFLIRKVHIPRDGASVPKLRFGKFAQFKQGEACFQ